MKYPYPSSIKEAAQTLDKINPDWFKEIDSASLDMGDCKLCILGQLFGYYDSADDTFDFDPWDETKLRDNIFGHTTNIQHWFNEIKERLNAQIS